jgi:hypothetical protein
LSRAARATSSSRTASSTGKVTVVPGIMSRRVGVGQPY